MKASLLNSANLISFSKTVLDRKFHRCNKKKAVAMHFDIFEERKAMAMSNCSITKEDYY